MDHDESELQQSNNPFAIAVLAGKYANDAKTDEVKRYRYGDGSGASFYSRNK
jgi:hypothetical protein